MTRNTPEHREWVLSYVRRYLATTTRPTRDGFRAWLSTQPSAPNRSDVDGVGLWRDLEREARATSSVDVSALEWDDDEDTVTTQPAPMIEAVSTEVAGEPRVPEPRELLELQRARSEVASLRRRLAAALEALHLADQRAGVVAELDSAPDPQPVTRRERTSGLREATAVVLCSDWHLEEVVDPRAIEGRNAYSPEIAASRVQRMTDGILWLLDMHRSKFALRDLVLWLGGDLISGYLHEELEETNALSPIEATLFAYEQVGGMIAALLERGDLERIVVPCNVGNHGRTTRKTRAKTRVQNSYEYLLYRQLEQRFAGEPRIEFAIAGGSHLYLDVYDQTIRFHHGDDVRYWGGVGGLTIPLTKSLAAWESFRHADLTCVGHFHQLLHGRDYVVNGSLIGYSEYALSIKAQFEPPQQAFFLLDSRRGRCCSTALWVDEAP